MNKIYKVKWNVHTQSYVACSELTKSQGKANKVLVNAMFAGLVCLGAVNTASAAECTSWDIRNNTNCEITTSTRVASVGNGGAGLSLGWPATTRTINVGIQSDLTFDLTATVGPFHPKGISINGGAGGADFSKGSNVTATNHNVTINLKQQGGATQDVPVVGLVAISGGKYEGKGVTINAVASNHIGTATESYGIQVGTANTGDDNRTAATSVVKIENANISLTNTADSKGNHQLSGIRVINGSHWRNGQSSTAYFESTGDLNIHVFDSSDTKSGGYLNGIYVSGPSNKNKVVLNNSKIVIETESTNGIHAAALKIGKERPVGTGGSSIESKGHMELDTTGAVLAPTVRLIGNNSLLKADYDTSSGDIKSENTAIEFGATDLIPFLDVDHNQQALFKDTKITTSDETEKALIQVNDNAVDAVFSLKGDSSEAIASAKGYLINVDGVTTTGGWLSDKTSASLTVNATDAGQMTGLTNKTDSSTLNLNLDNNFFWNLREHTATDGSTVKTSTFNTTTLTNGAVINAIKGDGTAAFELKGDVVSTGGVINLSDNRTTALYDVNAAIPGDVLTINGNYTADGSTVFLDTVFDDDLSATDLLHITGNSTGTNTLEISVVEGSIGAFTEKGIKVVQVDGESDENTNFVLKGDGKVSDDSITVGPENKHQFSYRLYQGTLDHPGTGTGNGIPAGVDTADIDTNDWYLRSTCSNGSHSVGSDFDVSINDGLGCQTDDQITVTTGADIAKVEGAGGADTIVVNSDAKVAGDVYGGNPGLDNSADTDKGDNITITGAAVVGGKVYGQLGDDTIIWSGDSSIAGLDGGVGSDTATVSSSKYDGTQLLDGGDDVSAADGFIDTLSLDGVQVTANGGKIVNWETIKLSNGTDLALAGTLTTGTGTSSAGDKLGLDISSDSTLAIAGTETAATVEGDVNNAGIIDLTRDDNSPSQTLTIDGNYTGVDGSTIKMDTVLGGDDSATDLVKITGNSNGTTTLDVSAVEGSIGGITKQGIKVVQVDGTSASDNYTLKDGAITVGPENKHQFTYRLYQGTNGATDTTGVDANDWYLRSTCSGTHSVGSAFGISVYDGLGCITDDTITVTTGADIVKVEGAGGGDTIVINSDAKVNGDVYGGNPGLDDSADTDKGDIITIADKAVVTGTVYSQAGDDAIIWSDAASIDGLNGGIGSDIATVTSSKYDGSQILDGGDDADVADGWIDTLNLNGVKITVNGGNIRNWEGINLKNTDLTLMGELLTGKGKTADGAQVGLNIDNTSVLAVSGTSAKVSGDVTNAGAIDLTRDNHKPSQTLTIDGDYIGSAGSKVKMNTVWNKVGDASGGNSQSDILTITGSATGQTSVIPVSSDGKDLVISGNVEQISAVINTIPVITVGKAGSERVFIGSALTPSGIEAQLAKRTVNGGDQYFWTIGGVEIPVEPPVVPPVTPVVPPVTPVDPVIPPVVPPVVPVVPSNPTYDPRVPGYVLMPRVNMDQGYATLRTLHERRGENQTLAWDNCGTCGEKANGQTWGRILGNYLEVDGKHRLGFETKSYGFQFGHDFAISRTNEGGHRLTGAYVSYNRANTTFKDEFSRENGVLLADKTAGKGKSDAWSLGITHTRYSPFGAYLDLVGQASFYRNKYEPRKYNNVSQNGVGVTLSAEVGKPYALNHHKPGESGWLIEPQAQLIYQMVDLKGFNDGTRQVNQNIQHGLRGRIGARLAYNTQADKDVYRTKTFYAVANIWSDFVKPSQIKLADNRLSENYASTWAEIGVGFQLPVRKQTYIYGDTRYEREIGGAKRDGYRGTIGIKYTWK